MIAREIIAAVRAAGADITIGGDGPRIRNGSRVSPAIIALCRANREAIIAELQPKPAQMPLELHGGPPVPFLDRQDALFRELCLEYGLDIGPFVPRKRSRTAA